MTDSPVLPDAQATPTRPGEAGSVGVSAWPGSDQRFIQSDSRLTSCRGPVTSPP